MTREIIKREDAKLVLSLLFLGSILELFVKDGMNIAILIMFSYICHKHFGNIKNSEEYKNYEFIDEGKYKKGLKKFAIFIDIYVAIRIINIFFS